MKIYTFFICIFSFCSSFAFPTETAKPKEGEGVYRFLLNNGRDPKEHYEEFVKLNKNKLGKDHSLIKGVSYILPPLSVEAANNKNTNSNKKREPLFGKKYSEYTIHSNKLRGATFFLASGHGGPDCGAIGIAEGKEIHEDEYAYDIMLRLARCLMMEGATVHIVIQDKHDGIRDDRFLKNNKKETCRGKEIPLNQMKRLQQRCDEINVLSRKSKDQYQRVLFIHLDSRSNNKQMDVFFYHHGNSAAGKRLGHTMRQTFKEHYQKHQSGRGFTGTVSARELYVLTNTKPVSLFAELGNIRNSDDQRRFLIDSNRQALANWMCRGFVADYENLKK
ncbi:MAG: N-acetylmuramoyl-L-alanine amidase [Tannerella sp.]|jgi:N-acetylmuramoyl-L-alanine amidase|nr:N-acetylmuramoyl-L-alanine amidase [Tannerella sp.]